MRVGADHEVTIGNSVIKTPGAFIGNIKGSVVVVFESVACSIKIGDIVKLRAHHYAVLDIIPAGKDVPARYAKSGMDMRAARRQTYIVTNKQDTRRVTASEVSIVAAGGNYEPD